MSAGQGSGFIVAADGVILSNAHVVRNSSSVMVKLRDGRQFKGEVFAVDTASDLAAIKISAVRKQNLFFLFDA